MKIKHFKQTTKYTCAAAGIVIANAERYDTEISKKQECQIWKYINGTIPILGNDPMKIVNYLKTFQKYVVIDFPTYKHIPWKKLPWYTRWMYRIVIWFFYCKYKLKNKRPGFAIRNDLALGHALQKYYLLLTVENGHLHYVLARRDPENSDYIIVSDSFNSNYSYYHEDDFKKIYDVKYFGLTIIF